MQGETKYVEVDDVWNGDGRIQSDPKSISSMLRKIGLGAVQG